MDIKARIVEFNFRVRVVCGNESEKTIASKAYELLKAEPLNRHDVILIEDDIDCPLMISEEIESRHGTGTHNYRDLWSEAYSKGKNLTTKENKEQGLTIFEFEDNSILTFRGKTRTITATY